MRAQFLRWAPTVVLVVGVLLSMSVGVRRIMPLNTSLSSVIPEEFNGYRSRDGELSEAEVQIAGASDHLYRLYTRDDSTQAGAALSLYVGYYNHQSQGKTIHSPKNCLPGSGWNVLASRTAQIPTTAGTETVNRYVLQRGRERALILYWYQGRGRVQADEYAVKWQLLRDSALRGRSEEALVRIVMPITQSEEDAFERAADLASVVMQALQVALPS